ncbi:MAG: hypothetical protein IKB67_02190 [Clostridia bacterium]|nr:hypothetical protein [Clostridia bacterium]
MAKIKIGWSEVDITPKKGTKIGLAGQFFERITDEVESPISVTAFALESGDDQMVIASCDLVAIGVNLYDKVKEMVSSKTDLAPEKIIISAIHTHTSYVYTRTGCLSKKVQEAGFDDSLGSLKYMVPPEMAYQPLVSNEKSMDPDAAFEFLAEKVTEAIVSAWNNRKPSYYQNAFGRAVVGMCRRVCYDDGSAKMWGDTNLANFEALEAGNDSGIELIYTFDENKQLSGVIANIACPAQVVEHRSYISSDYWGKVKANLRAKYGDHIQVLGLCSAAGDQCPRDMIRWVEPESYIDDPNIKRANVIERRADPSMFDVSGLKLVGKRISNEIISVFEELGDDFKDESLLVHENYTITLPLRTVTIAEYNNAVEIIDKFIEKNRGRRISFEDNALMHVYSGTIRRYHLQQRINTWDTEIHIVRFGDIAIATNPFELFLDYGNQIRARSKAKQTFIIQLACGSAGYLPTEKAEKGSHYSAYVSGGNTGHVGGNLLVRETLERINNKF